MLGLEDVAVFVLAACGLVAGGYLLALRRLLREKHRADEAEQRARSLLTVLETLSPARPAPVLAAKEPPVGSLHAPPISWSDGSTPRPAPTLEARYLFVSFEEEIQQARGHGIPLTLLTLSLGDSPKAEDPGIADRRLRSVAHVVRGQMRGCDTCIRYAADVFILILPGVAREEARRVEARFRVALQGVTPESRPGLTSRARASLGSATFPEDGGSFDQLLTLADSRRTQDCTTPPPGMPTRPAAAARFRVPPPALSRN
ncbi:MAG: hypothetical protein DMH00_13480 [Acidobacteria bacterium]|nr:MAG: hypothetical protein DMH00_13480 [Acidobacteriota bacterium]